MIQDIAFQFRQATDRQPSGKTPILGPARCMAEEMRAYIHRRNPAAPDVAECYLQMGERYGVRGDLAYCQAVYETKAWANASVNVQESSAASAALTAARRRSALFLRAGASASAGYDTEAAIEEHILRLGQFAALPVSSPYADADDSEGTGRRREVCWEDLNGVWRVPGLHYGQDIVAIWRKMLEWAGKGGVRVEKFKTSQSAHPDQSGRIRPAYESDGQRAHAVDWSTLANEDMVWLQAQGLLPQPTPHPDRRVTWAELARLLRGFAPPAPAAAARPATETEPAAANQADAQAPAAGVLAAETPATETD
ncbi:hypothetical protein [Cohnella nanjingensis]|uniref:Uncharacterized protein n=1 Tax=Cohnella nanjingensis TaxID=1387779 RepID=A0A7X0RMP9_9BACL|nr:hypothetical protein [Cohnella nanjingensis]MBB6670310.1 hypothetical protein [Cohnella nanjingensis]